MAQAIPKEFLDLFEKRAFAHLATLMADGTPQVSPVWVDYDGQYILINSARGRAKDRNMEERPSVAMDITDPDNSYRYLGIRGKVVEITEEGGYEHICKLSQKYKGNPNYPRNPGEVRVIYKIEPEKVRTNG